MSTLISAQVSRDPLSAEVEVIRDEKAWDALESEWNRLVEITPNAVSFHRFEWMRQWWRTFGGEYAVPQGLRIVAIRHGGKLIGLLPLYESMETNLAPVRRLMFLSTGEEEREETCADYLDLIYDPGCEDLCVRTAWDALLDRGKLAWDLLELTRMSERSPLLKGISRLPRRDVARIRVCGLCAVSDLSGGFDAFLQRQSFSTKKELRRLINMAERAGVVFEVARTAEQIEEFFQQLIDLHQSRWQGAGHSGCFAAPRFTAFHRALLQEWIIQGKAILARISIDGECVSAIYGFRIGDRFDSYIQGSALSCEKIKSPGTAMAMLMRRYLAEQGVGVYDDLMGQPDAPKQRFATSQPPLVTLRVVRLGARTAAHLATDFSHRAFRKGIRLLRRRVPALPQG